MSESDWSRYNRHAELAAAAGHDIAPYISRAEANAEVRAMVARDRLERAQ